MIDDKLAGLVMDSCNDVLRGYQTFEEHLEYLASLAEEFPRQLDLSEPTISERIYQNEENHRSENRSEPRCTDNTATTAPVSGTVQGHFGWSS